MSKQGVVDALSNLTGDITLGMNVGGVVIPIVIGAVKDIKAWLNADQNITFTVALETGNQEAADGLQAFKDSLTSVNAELAKDGKPPIADPTTV